MKEALKKRFIKEIGTRSSPLVESIAERCAESALEFFSSHKQLCPKCNGQGVVSKPPHIAGDVELWSGTELSYKCNLCDGKMVISPL